jgi:hyaluronoglucosaminidase
MKNNYKSLNGYIEGYYGRLLTWEERYRIILRLNKNKMNFYFYAPKEDEKHRFNWKLKYDYKWTQNFITFCEIAKRNNIKIIIGISPGFTFNFKEVENKKSKDLTTLAIKSHFFLDKGADDVALLFDDLPNNFKKIYGQSSSEGFAHALLANKLSALLNKPIYIVPRIYSDQLIFEDRKYLFDYGKHINNNNITFYSGKNIVAKKINKFTINKISKIIPTKVVIWDNFYSNDYCPRRIFLGPYIGRSEVKNIMINPTGLIETDLLILDIINATKNNLHPTLIWKKTLLKHQVPSQFFDVSNYFLQPDFGQHPAINKATILSKTIESLNFLLWKWKSPLSREWYPFLLGLKHDLQIMTNDFTSERIIKTQTKALANYIIKQ